MPSHRPTAFHLSSSGLTDGVSTTGSSNIAIASRKSIPCLSMLAVRFASSHSKPASSSGPILHASLRRGGSALVRQSSASLSFDTVGPPNGQRSARHGHRTPRRNVYTEQGTPVKKLSLFVALRLPAQPDLRERPVQSPSTASTVPRLQISSNQAASAGWALRQSWPGSCRSRWASMAASAMSPRVNCVPAAKGRSPSLPAAVARPSRTRVRRRAIQSPLAPGVPGQFSAGAGNVEIDRGGVDAFGERLPGLDLEDVCRVRRHQGGHRPDGLQVIEDRPRVPEDNLAAEADQRVPVQRVLRDALAGPPGHVLDQPVGQPLFAQRDQHPAGVRPRHGRDHGDRAVRQLPGVGRRAARPRPTQRFGRRGFGILGFPLLPAGAARAPRCRRRSTRHSPGVRAAARSPRRRPAPRRARRCPAG